jgi:hypothetical protein
MYLHIGGGVAQDLKSRESSSRVGTTSNNIQRPVVLATGLFLMLNAEG